jgi:pyrroloquinoline quinone biosynthesis protein E
MTPSEPSDGMNIHSLSEPRPYTLVAELTHRCPLRCAYCSNPLELVGDELATSDWLRAFDDAARLGVAQLHLSGGEPALRDDLSALVARARSLDLYANLITSGATLDRARLGELRDAGLDNVQLSVQDVDAAAGDRLAGARVAARKLDVARWTRELGLPLALNVVLHRGNIDRVGELVALAEELGAHRLELANAQYHGWALRNRAALLPARDQLERAQKIAHAAKNRLVGRVEVLFVLPDYFAAHPRACMGGWARRYIVIAPDGIALPCHAARELPLDWQNVRTRSLVDIWRDSPGFARFRGEAWLPEPCRSCDRRAIDFGGCRCQAFALLGDAALTDPACAKSPHHDRVAGARGEHAGEFVYRSRVGRRARSEE